MKLSKTQCTMLGFLIGLFSLWLFNVLPWWWLVCVVAFAIAVLAELYKTR